METGLGNLCGKENKTVKTGQDGVAVYKYGRKRAGGHSGTPAKPSVGCYFALIKKKAFVALEFTSECPAGGSFELILPPRQDFVRPQASLRILSGFTF